MTWREWVELGLVGAFVFCGGMVGYHAARVRDNWLRAELAAAEAEGDSPVGGTGGAVR